MVFSNVYNKIQLATDWARRSVSRGLLQTSETTSVFVCPIVMYEEQEEEAEAS